MKLNLPPLGPNLIRRSRLTERLNEGIHRKLTLVSASAGFGKTTMVSEWLSGLSLPAAWVSLEEGDNDPERFLTYLVAALQKAGIPLGESMFNLLQTPQPFPVELLLTILLNGINSVHEPLILVLDDYHLIHAKPVDHIITYLLDHLPSQMHLVVITREDPQFPLSRLRAQNQLNELRVIDLRFTSFETSEFLAKVMDVTLSTKEIDLLEARIEGWIAGLQLAAISMQGHLDIKGFIQSFKGSNRFVMDYLLEEVLLKQSDRTQTFLLQTSILDRLCGPLCDAVSGGDDGQEILAMLERTNLFVLPLDYERRWYRYHHLFGELLRQRLHQKYAPVDLHRRASQWYEDNGLELDALHHATAANEVDRAARLIEGDGMPMHFRGAAAPVLNWLESQPRAVLDERPSLWVIYASALLMAGRLSAVEHKLLAAEEALSDTEKNAQTRDLFGHIASIRATIAVTRHESETIITESNRALELLDPGNLPVRTATTWALGYAYQLQGNREAAGKAYVEAIAASEAIGHKIMAIMSTLGLGIIQELENQYHLAADTYRRVLQLTGDPPLPVACEAHLGLGRIYYEWNDLVRAEQHGQLYVQLAQQLEATDRVIAGEVFLAKLMFAQGDKSGGSAMLARAEYMAHLHEYKNQIPQITAIRKQMEFREGNLAAVADLATSHVEDRLQTIILQAIEQFSRGEIKGSVALLSEALALAAPEGFIRSFLDLGIPMAQLLDEAHSRGIMPEYTDKLLTGFPTPQREAKSSQHLIEALSQREIDILQLIAQGYSNEEIGRKLFLAVSTVKGHNRNIFEKLQVQRRTEAVALAHKLGLIHLD